MENVLDDIPSTTWKVSWEQKYEVQKHDTGICLCIDALHKFYLNDDKSKTYQFDVPQSCFTFHFKDLSWTAKTAIAKYWMHNQKTITESFEINNEVKLPQTGITFDNLTTQDRIFYIELDLCFQKITLEFGGLQLRKTYQRHEAENWPTELLGTLRLLKTKEQVEEWGKSACKRLEKYHNMEEEFKPAWMEPLGTIADEGFRKLLNFDQRKLAEQFLGCCENICTTCKPFDGLTYGRVLFMKGKFYSNQDMLPRNDSSVINAETWFLQALEKLPNNATDIRGDVLNSLGNVYFRQGDNEKALEKYSLANSLPIEDAWIRGNVLQSLAKWYKRKKNLDLATQYLNEAENCYKGKHENGVGSVNLTRIKLDLKKLKSGQLEAEPNIVQAIDSLENSKWCTNTFNSAVMAYYKAKFLCMQKEFQQALDALKKLKENLTKLKPATLFSLRANALYLESLLKNKRAKEDQINGLFERAGWTAERIQNKKTRLKQLANGM